LRASGTTKRAAGLRASGTTSREGGNELSGRAYSLLCVEGGRTRQRREIGAVAAYAALFALGAMEGLIGSFQFSHTLGPVPVASLAFCALILATSLLGAAGMGTALGGVLPAIGWMAAAFLLTLPTAAGSVIVTNTSAGEWYLYGGAICAAIGVVASLRWRPRRPRGHRWPGAGA
jgi:hypothetical protein